MANNIHISLLSQKINSLEYLTYSVVSEEEEIICSKAENEEVKVSICGKYGDSFEEQQQKGLSLEIVMDCFINKFNTRTIKLDMLYIFSVDDFDIFDKEGKKSKLLKDTILYHFVVLSSEKIKQISSIDDFSSIDIIDKLTEDLEKLSNNYCETYGSKIKLDK